MAVAILYRLAEEPEVTFEQVFDDVSAEDWFGNAVVWAYQNMIVQRSEDAYFSPDEDITREQFFMMLYRFAAFMEYTVDVPADFDCNIPDADLLYDWTAEGLRWASYKGLIVDMDDETFELEGIVTRAECAVVLYRLVAMLEQAEDAPRNVQYPIYAH
jgi:hypothetical protein